MNSCIANRLRVELRLQRITVIDRCTATSELILIVCRHNPRSCLVPVMIAFSYWTNPEIIHSFLWVCAHRSIFVQFSRANESQKTYKIHSMDRCANQTWEHVWFHQTSAFMVPNSDSSSVRSLGWCVQLPRFVRDADKLCRPNGFVLSTVATFISGSIASCMQYAQCSDLFSHRMGGVRQWSGHSISIWSVSMDDMLIDLFLTNLNSTVQK